jgi:rRNA maturation endonuclease Nob1
MTSLEAVEIERAKLHSIKCSMCKVNLMIRPTEKVCPVCGSQLPNRKK